jgi:hypothetical protein
MENKIIIGMVITGLILIGAIGVMSFILLTREPIVEPIKKEEEVVEEIIEEPPPLEEEALLQATKIVGERLRVFDVEERQDAMLIAIKAEFSPGMTSAEKKIVIEMVVDTELSIWKDQVIRDTLIELHGEYSSEDYSAIDRKTHIDKLKTFVSAFEMEVLGID